MEILKNYEKKVLNLLVSEVLSSDQLESIMRDAKLLGYEYTGCGYYLKIGHPSLPNERIVCSEPIVIGEAEDVTCGFVVFLQDNTLTLECHTWGEVDVPEDFRNKNVRVNPAAIESGKFVITKSD